MTAQVAAQVTTQATTQGRIRQGCKLVLALMLSGCVAHSPYDRQQVSSELSTKAGGSLKPQMDTHFSVPAGVVLSDGLSDDEAVDVALWNNASLQMSMAQLGMAQADLTTAGALPNPVLGLLFPGSPAHYEATLSLPIDLLTRHARVSAAKEEVERVAAMMVADGMALAREVRIAHAEAIASEQKYQLLQEQMVVVADLLRIATVQVETGKIDKQSLATQRAQQAELSVMVAQAEHAVMAARYRLHELLGLDVATIALNLTLTPGTLSDMAVAELDVMLHTALESRPEIKANEADIERAGYQDKWERNKLLNLIAELKLVQTDSGRNTSPGAQMELPLFNQNQGGRSHASAELDRAVQSFVVTQQAIRREVSTARASYLAASQSHTLLKDTVLPALQAELDLSREANTLGNQSYWQLAQVQSRYLQAQVRLVDAQLAVQRAHVKLIHSVGQPVKRLITETGVQTKPVGVTAP